MSTAALAPQGVGLVARSGQDPGSAGLSEALARLGLATWCDIEPRESAGSAHVTVRLTAAAFAELCPGFDTLGLPARLARHGLSADTHALEREVWVALLAAPQRIDFDSLQDLQAHVRVRCNIARAADKTALAFKTTDAAERPDAFWHYRDDVGFLLQPDAGLVDALVAATQPERTGRLYDFSCYRATEYVILLGLAQEAQHSDPEFYACLEASARQTCIKSGRFHEVFLIEQGSFEAPMPMRFYVPGDRVWFKNPDPVSSDISGYEGSWVIYLGAGLFSNFWKLGQHFTLEAKALEVYHWRHGVFRDPAAELQIDENVVEARVLATQADAAQYAHVLQQMNRYRDPTGIYQDGGCIDATREFPRPLSRIRLD